MVFAQGSSIKIPGKPASGGGGGGGGRGNFISDTVACHDAPCPFDPLNRGRQWSAEKWNYFRLGAPVCEIRARTAMSGERLERSPLEKSLNYHEHWRETKELLARQLIRGRRSYCLIVPLHRRRCARLREHHRQRKGGDRERERERSILSIFARQRCT